MNERRDNVFISMINPKSHSDQFAKVLEEMQKRGPNETQNRGTTKELKPTPRLMTIIPPPVIEDTSELEPKRTPGIVLHADPSESTIGDQSLDSFRRVSLKIDTPNHCVWIELVQHSSKEYVKYRVQIYFDDLVMLNLESSSNTLTIECEAYATEKLVQKQSSDKRGDIAFEWTFATLSDILDWNLKTIRASLRLEWSEANRKLSDRSDILDRLSIQSKQLTVDGKPYEKSNDSISDDLPSARKTLPRVYGPSLIRESTEGGYKKEDVVERAVEEKVFDDNFKQNEFIELSKLEAVELSRLL